MLKIFRIEEKKTKLGPFRFINKKSGSSMIQTLSLLDLLEDFNCITPDEDREISDWWKNIPDDLKASYFFGFTSLIKAKSFFSETCNDYLHHNNFHIVEYNSYSGVVGENQVLFLSDLATKIKEHALILEQL